MSQFELPSIGLGTSQNSGDQCAKSVEAALELGYRHIDTAQMYGNETAVGAGIRASSVSRDEIVVATKVAPENLAPDDVQTSTRKSLDRLGLDFVDLLYIHWPMGAYEVPGTVDAFQEVYDEGLTRNVGVSNFTRELFEEARDRLSCPIVANQVEMHPYFPQSDLRSFLASHGVTLVSYAPLVRGAVLDQEELLTVAKRHEATPAQIALAWLISHDNVVTIPKATGEEHLRENLAAREISLTSEDIAEINSIEHTERFFNPDGSPW